MAKIKIDLPTGAASVWKLPEYDVPTYVTYGAGGSGTSVDVIVGETDGKPIGFGTETEHKAATAPGVKPATLSKGMKALADWYEQHKDSSGISPLLNKPPKAYSNDQFMKGYQQTFDELPSKASMNVYQHVAWLGMNPDLVLSAAPGGKWQVFSLSYAKSGQHRAAVAATPFEALEKAHKYAFPCDAGYDAMLHDEKEGLT